MDYIHSHLLNKEQVAICLGLLRNAKNNGNSYYLTSGAIIILWPKLILIKITLT